MRGDNLPPLERRAFRRWHGLAARVLVSVLLVVLAFLLLWFDRDGLRDVDGHLTFADVIYFTMITVSTVGYGDIVPISERARLIDAFLITPIRIFLWLIFLGTAAEILIKHSWENWRMRNIQRTLKDHVVLAGFGGSGRKVLEELLTAGTPVGRIVVIDPDSEAIDLAKTFGVATIRGDATRDEVHDAVHVERATNMIVSCGRDDTSILTVLTARHLTPSIRIAVAIRNADNEDLAYQAGADVVVNPASVSGLLLATTSHGKHLTDALTDLATTRGNIRLQERAATREEVGRSLNDISGGRALRLYRGAEMLSLDDARPPMVESGDLIVEIVSSSRS